MLAEEIQVTDAVRFWGLPLLKLPVAANCCFDPTAMDGLAGVMAIAVSPVTLPVPVRVTMMGLPEALYGIVSVPVRAPITVGENCTPTVQAVPAATGLPHELALTVKSPLAVIGCTVSVEPVLFETVTV